MLNFIPDSTTAVREMVRVTKPGGSVAAALWDMRGGLPHLRMLFDVAAAIDDEAATWRNRFLAAPGVRPGALAELWRTAGLVDVEEANLTVRIEFQAFADLWEPAVAAPVLGSYLRAISDAQRQLVREKVEQTRRHSRHRELQCVSSALVAGPYQEREDGGMPYQRGKA